MAAHRVAASCGCHSSYCRAAVRRGPGEDSPCRLQRAEPEVSGQRVRSTLSTPLLQQPSPNPTTVSDVDDLGGPRSWEFGSDNATCRSADYTAAAAECACSGAGWVCLSVLWACGRSCKMGLGFGLGLGFVGWFCLIGALGLGGERALLSDVG
jgi:hypothetical protein